VLVSVLVSLGAASEAAGPDLTTQELAELALDERWDTAGVLRRREERREMGAHDAVEHRVFGARGRYAWIGRRDRQCASSGASTARG
jgi:hypothetical protein